MNKKILRHFTVILVLILLSVTAGCTRKNDVPVFDNSDPYAVEPGVEWILVTAPYAACYSEPGYGASVSEHLRKGVIRRVLGTQSVKVDGNFEKWYSLDEGWIPGSFVQVYSNKLKAEKALENL